ncbi:hypothetical protein EDB89DRAFT_2074118 [Lactarius sanguifluus]|nr:hypothetical protein EDB89DRAFT_2074118 [Lactarius sanguifluus]
MSLPRSDSVESICSVLTFTSNEFKDVYENENLLTEVLSDEALRGIIDRNRVRLREADSRYRLDDLLSAMLLHAPHSSGRRYVAVCLHIAHQKGEDGVVNAAKAWLDNLLLPMLAISKAVKTEPASSQTPTIDTTVQYIESASRRDQPTLRSKVALRERYRCAITKAFDITLARKLAKERRAGEIPDVAQHPMEAAHIIPFLLNKFDDKVISSPQIVRNVLSSSRPTHLCRQTSAARTWDMLQSWTQINFKTLIGSNINSPTNAVYMTKVEHTNFGRFDFYLDKEAFPDSPNKYKVHMSRDGGILTNGLREGDVEFPTLEESSIEPPNPEYLKVHAAFAKVLHLCGAAEYIDSVERDAEMEGTLRLNGETDFGSYLQSKFPIVAY